MGWIKRNLFFVIGLAVAIGLLGFGGYFIYASWDHNTRAFNDLTEVVGQLQNYTGQKPSPGNEKINNTQIAKEQNEQLQQWLATAAENFSVIQPIPAGDVTGANFSGALQKTLDQLRREADAGGVALPPKFAFSFTAENDRLNFTPAGLPALAQQLGETAAIARILFAARVNALDGVQRVRASDDDASGQPSDYIDETPVTNGLAVITPYVVTFRAFTPELASVLAGFATAKNAFIVKAVNVARADNSAQGMTSSAGEMPPGAPPMMRMPGEFPPAIPAQPVGVPPAGKGGLQTVLKEQLLRVTLEVQLVKPLPKNATKT
jgi:hypothetical protein